MVQESKAAAQETVAGLPIRCFQFMFGGSTFIIFPDRGPVQGSTHALVCSTAEICLAFVAGFTGEVWCLHRPEGPVADAFYKPLAQALGPLAVRVSTGMPQVSWLAPPALQCRFEVLPLRRRGGGLLTSCSDGFP